MSEERAVTGGVRERALPMAGEPERRPSMEEVDTRSRSLAREASATRSGAHGRERDRSMAAGPGMVAGEAGMDRRHALKVMALAAAAPGLASCGPGGSGDGPAASASAVATGLQSSAAPGQVANPHARGDLWDPDLLRPVVPWERQLDPDELESLAALCDVILPADDRSPSASQVGAHDFIDEWVSAPYEAMREGGVLIRGGLAWLDREAHARFGDGAAPPGVRFRDLATAQRHAICDDIHDPKRAEGGPFEAPSLFFDRVRYLTLTAFWTTEEGMDDLGYVGNTPLARWDPPPPEVLRHIGLG